MLHELFLILVQESAVWLLVQISGRTDDWRQTDDKRPLQSEVILMSDSAAEYAKYAAAAAVVLQFVLQ